MELYPPNFAEFPSLSMSSSGRVSARAPAWCNCTSSQQHVPIAAWAIFGFQKMTGSPIDFKEKWPKNYLPEKCLMCGYRSLLVQVPKKMRAVARPKKTAPGSGWAGQNLALHHVPGRLALEIHRFQGKTRERLEYWMDMNGYEWLMASNGWRDTIWSSNLAIWFTLWWKSDVVRPSGFTGKSKQEIPELNEGLWCGNDLYCKYCKWGTFNCHLWLPEGKGNWPSVGRSYQI